MTPRELPLPVGRGTSTCSNGTDGRAGPSVAPAWNTRRVSWVISQITALM